MIAARGKPDVRNASSPELGIELCGVSLRNPLIAASGTFGFAREYGELYDVSCWGGISLKGLTLEPRAGNPPPRIVETASGMLNSVGLQNPGVERFITEEMPRLSSLGIPLIANVAGSSEDEYREIVLRLCDTAVDLIELNISCPNVRKGGRHFAVSPSGVAEITRSVRDVCSKPLIVKLSPNVTDIGEISRAAEENGADAVSLINTLSGMAIDLDARKPLLANITGGLSGPAIKPIALRMVWEAAQAVKIPVVGMGGITSGRDVAEFMVAGAAAVMIGTANIADPLAGPRILNEFCEYLAHAGEARAASLVGSLRI